MNGPDYEIMHVSMHRALLQYQYDAVFLSQQFCIPYHNEKLLYMVKNLCALISLQIVY